jgi:AAA family ATP:ADP antiporter
MKVVREPLILASGGVNVRAYAAAGQALVLLGAVPLYGWLAGRVARRKLITTVTAFFIGCLVVFYALALASAPVGAVFFVWLGVFNVMVIAQFWSFANDVYTEDEGKRLFPIVAFGASSGAVIGAWLPGRLIEPLGVYQLLLVAGALLVAATALTAIVDARERRRTEADVPDVLSTGAMPAATGQFRAASGEFREVSQEYHDESGVFRPVKREPETPSPRASRTANAFRLVFRSRYLLLIALLMLFLNWVNTTGENILFGFVERTATAAVEAGESGGLTAEEFTGKFYSDFQSVVNVAGLLIQLFLVSRIIKFFGIPVAILVLPLIAFVGYSLIIVYPVLGAIRWAKTAENSTDYSLQNTARQALFLPTTREEKYAAKQAIDSFFQRAGDVMAAGLWFVGAELLALELEQFALANLGLIVVWAVLAFFIGRRYVRLAAVTRR